MTVSANRRAFIRGALAACILPRLDARQTERVQPAKNGRGIRAGQETTIASLALRWCPAGEFIMGSTPTEPGHRPDEAAVRVRLSKGFWMAAHEVTQSQWTRVVGAFPDRPPTDEFGRGDDIPVYWISHHEATHFCTQLTAQAHRARQLPESWEFRLPTEAQWEYACRANTQSAFAFGRSLDPASANFGSLVRRDSIDPSRPGRAQRVGTYAANPWGIADMHGNIFEWCRDWYHDRLPGGVDPDLSHVVGVRNGDGTYSRVRRGGAWNDPANFCRSAMRLRYEPHRRSDHIGFRVAVVESSNG